MVRALIRHLRGEPEACSVIRVPSPEQEDARRLHRERDRLIAERVAHVNRVKGLCATQGIYDYEPLRSDRLKRLEKLRTGDGRALAPRLKAEIVREIKRTVASYRDPRDWIDILRQQGEVEEIRGTSWDLEIGALIEIACRESAGYPPSLLFRDIPGYASDRRVPTSLA
jgi:hypothetical protein